MEMIEWFEVRGKEVRNTSKEIRSKKFKVRNVKYYLKK